MAWDRKRLVRTLFIAEVVIGVVLSCYLFANVGSSSVSGDGFRAVWYALLISALSGASYLVIFKIQEQFNWGIMVGGIGAMLVYTVVSIIYTHNARLPGSALFTLLIIYAVVSGLLAFFLHVWRDEYINIGDERIQSSPGREAFKDDYNTI